MNQTDPINRIDAAFAALRARNKRAFIAYICCGDPSLESTVDLVAALEEAGADVVELGIPSPTRWLMAS